MFLLVSILSTLLMIGWCFVVFVLDCLISQGFYYMLKNRTKLIFIRTPGAKKTLSKYSKDDFTKELEGAVMVSKARI